MNGGDATVCTYERFEKRFGSAGKDRGVSSWLGDGGVWCDSRSCLSLVRCSKGEEKAAAVFRVFQIDATFVGGDLQYMKADLFEGSRLHITSCSLTGGPQ